MTILNLGFMDTTVQELKHTIKALIHHRFFLFLFDYNGEGISYLAINDELLEEGYEVGVIIHN